MKKVPLFLFAAPLVFMAAGAGRAPEALPAPRGETASAAGDDAFLEDLSRRSFRYFADNADPGTGLVLDRARADGSQADAGRGSAASSA